MSETPGAHSGPVSSCLRQQTALSEILRVIASSPVNLGRVFDVVATSVLRLSRADHG